MMSRLFKFLLVMVLFNLFPLTTLAAGLTILNTSDRFANISINHQDCETSGTCNIAPGSVIHFEQEKMSTLCQSHAQRCELNFGVDIMQASIGLVYFDSEQDVIAYSVQSKLIDYTVRQMTNHAVEIAKRSR